MTINNRIIHLWDFDGVLFKNRDYNYTNGYLTFDKITSKVKLLIKFIRFKKKDINILFTGRGSFQSKKILRLLKRKGYEFKGSIFWMKKREQYPTFNPNINEEDYNEKYYEWKRSIIREKVIEFGKYKVQVIDDSGKIIQIAKEEFAKARRITI